MPCMSLVHRLTTGCSSGGRRVGGVLPLAAFILAGLASASPARAQDPSPLARLEALGLDTMQVGRVTVYFDATDRERAEQLASLSEANAAYYEDELGVSFPLHLAVLSPEHWFNPYEGGELEPYGMPWGWVPEQLMTVPASLDEGVLIFGPDELANRRRVQFVLLHEFGHLASKQYFHPTSNRDYSSVRWFEELLATYWAYAFVRSHDPEWARKIQGEWVDFVAAYTPPVLSLDWGWNVMDGLPPEEWARLFAWYQNLLNLRVAELYEEHGVGFLRAVKDQLAWEDGGDWTTASLLPALEEIAPGFVAWADGLQRGEY